MTSTLVQKGGGEFHDGRGGGGFWTAPNNDNITYELPIFGPKFALGWGCRLEGQEGNKEPEVEKRRFVFLIQSTYNRYVLYFLKSWPKLGIDARSLHKWPKKREAHCQEQSMDNLSSSIV